MSGAVGRGTHRAQAWASPRHLPLVVATFTTDRRCLADLRCVPGETDPQVVLERGRCLNRELPEKRGPASVGVGRRRQGARPGELPALGPLHSAYSAARRSPMIGLRTRPDHARSLRLPTPMARQTIRRPTPA